MAKSSGGGGGGGGGRGGGGETASLEREFAESALGSLDESFEFLAREFSEWEFALSGARAGVIESWDAYKRTAFRELNEQLRSGKPLEGELRAIHFDMATSIAAKAPRLGRDLTVYRGITKDDAAKLLPQLETGATFTDSGFVSTSTLRSVANDFAGGALLQIKVPAGSKVGNMNARSIATFGHPSGFLMSRRDWKEATGEQEIILRAGANFRVVGRGTTTVNGNRLPTVFLEYVPGKYGY